jgi:hypothetical protein
LSDEEEMPPGTPVKAARPFGFNPPAVKLRAKMMEESQLRRVPVPEEVAGLQ